MALFKVTVKQNRNTNGVKLEKGMSVEISSNYSNPLKTNNGHEVGEAFMRIYGIDLKKSAGGSVSSLGAYFDVQKIN